jgi:hypothetical protein
MKKFGNLGVNMTIYLKEMKCENVDWIKVA